jgi:hypothetical protein
VRTISSAFSFPVWATFDNLANWKIWLHGLLVFHFEHLEKLLRFATIPTEQLQLPKPVFHAREVLIKVLEKNHRGVEVEGTPDQESVNEVHVIVPKKRRISN